LKNERIYAVATTLENLINGKRSYARLRRTVSIAKKSCIRELLENLNFRKPEAKVYWFIRRIQNKEPSNTSNPLLSSL